MKNSETRHLKKMKTKELIIFGNTDVVQIFVQVDNMKKIHVIVNVDLVMILMGIVKKKAQAITILLIELDVLKDIFIPDIMQNVVH